MKKTQHKKLKVFSYFMMIPLGLVLFLFGMLGER